MARDKKILSEKTALLLVDVQNSEIQPSKAQTHPEYQDQIRNVALPSIKKLVEFARRNEIEVVYTVIEAMTLDGRDRSLDHKLSEMLIPAGSPLGQVIDDVRPMGDEMVFKKTSSGVFNSTNLDYVLRNLGVENLIVTGFLTDQCVDMAVRDGADRGYYMICVADACATHTQARHQNALEAFGGYCLVMSADDLIDNLSKERG